MVHTVEIDARDRERFNAWVERSPLADFRQTYEWGELRAQTGWQTRRFLLLDEEDIVASASIMTGRLPHLPFTLMSVPYGPIADYDSPRVLEALVDLLRRVGHEMRADLVRIDPFVTAEDATARAHLAAAGFIANPLPWSHWNGPCQVAQVDITAPEETLFRALNRNKRAHIRLFDKNGYRVESSDRLSDLLAFRHLLSGVGAQRGFLVRDEAYWRALSTEFLARGHGVLLLARDGEQILGGVFLVVCGRTCHFWYAADNAAVERPAERPNDALHWAALCYARSRGCTVANLGAWVSESHLRYKRGFGAEVFRSLGYHDLVLRPTRYRLFRLTEERFLPRAVRLVAKLQALRRREAPPPAVHDGSAPKPSPSSAATVTPGASE